ncbi:hypothetical protein J7649_16490 (plasmid) [Acinetobacter lwoffii]|jgi:hypothetical protein|uniref:Uncharacterized protein n=4 Tax=Acinetobacter TaxID=469 RepID=N9HDN4_ACILW|nr:MULTISPECIES: hypothetical protein [Gammaproteobacteria]HAZ8114335.1 hypothetical protein [Escherichia coli]EET83870.1 hypothetical protein ACIRA0001_0429 [Acinetobacter radioresistens SK82]EHU3217659.1 hypothetical protein [Acinetobacter baumannii]EJO33834.1 hypothetical protein ACINWCA157_A0032 [Acinetobacter radioresistens WC-A-157]ELA8727656.1 hypothetical protein [Acinetobacter baumannii]
MKREQLYVSDEFAAEFDEFFLRYKRGELKVPEELQNRRLTRNLIFLIALDQYFKEKHNFSNSPFED